MHYDNRIVSPLNTSISTAPSPGAGTSEFPSPLSESTQIDPYAAYERLRSVGGNVVAVHFSGLGPKGATVAVLGMKEARQVLADGATFPTMHANSRPPRNDSGTVSSYGEFSKNVVIFKNGDELGVLKSPLLHAFTPKAMEGMRPHVEKIIREILNSARSAGKPVDFVRSIARPYPVFVMADLLGVDRDLAGVISEHLVAMPRAHGVFSAKEDLRDAGIGIQKATEIIDSHVHKFSPAPVINSMLEQCENEKWTHRDLIVNFAFMFAAGYETSASSLTNFFNLLVTTPELADILRSGANQRKLISDESFRFAPAVQVTSRRCAVDTRLGGVTVSAGTQILVVIAAANRDVRFVDNPHEFNPARGAGSGITFGHGPHLCLGKWLAELEGEVFAEAIANSPVLGKPDLRGETKFTFDGTFLGAERYEIDTI